MARVKIPLGVPFLYPPVCVCCKRQAVTVREQTFRYRSIWSVLLLVLSIGVGSLFILERVATLLLPVCERHDGRKQSKSYRHFLVGVPVMAALAAVCWFLYPFNQDAAVLLGIALVVGAVIYLSVALGDSNAKLPVAASCIETDAIYLTGVSRAFAEAAEGRDEIVELTPAAAGPPAKSLAR